MKPSSITDIDDVIADPSRHVAIVAQPIIDLRRGVVVGYETLARFELTSGRQAAPNKVFATAIRAGLGPQLEAVVIERALELAKETPRNCFITINVDPLHLPTAEVLDVTDRFGDLGGVIFELTEHNNAADNLSDIKQAAETLRRRGAMIAIDDAGIGYSGLKQIIELQPQFLKVDRELISGLQTSEPKRVLIQMLGDLANRLNTWLVAEGIESEPELNALVQLGVPLGQGYLLATPAAPWASLSTDGAAALLRTRRGLPSGNNAAAATTGAVGGVVGEIIEPPALCRGDENWPPQSPIAIRVDAHGRPIEMRLQSEHEGERIRMELDLLRVKRACPTPEVALRVTTRSDRLRWDPVVCINEQGHLEGIVQVHRIMSTLADRFVDLPSKPNPGAAKTVRALIAVDPRSVASDS